MSDCACGCDGDCGCGSRQISLDIGDRLVFRHSAILGRLKGELSSTRVEGEAPLARWTTREPSDPVVALLDAQAAALHVLAWNINRLWADGALHTSEDPSAVGAIARLLGYAPRPALAAATVVSFDLDDIATAPDGVDLPRGIKIASVPLKDELPQTFETDAPLHARKAWNRLKVTRKPANPEISTATLSLTLEGAVAGIRVGDLILVYAGGNPCQWLAARVVSVDRPAAASPSSPATTVLSLASQALVGRHPDFAASSFSNQVILLGDRASAFGSTAPDLSLFTKAHLKDIGQMTGTERPAEWKDLVMTTTGTSTEGTLDLEAVHDAAMAGKAVLFTAIDGTPAAQMGKITAVQEGARKGFGLSAKVSRITVTGVDLTGSQTGFAAKVRETTILIETGRARLFVPETDARIPAEKAPNRIVVAGRQALEAGRKLILKGRDHHSGESCGEVLTLARADVGAAETTLLFTASLANAYHAEGLEIHGNCVGVSQGETPVSGAETLGKGEAGMPLPRFRLKSGPVAHVPAKSAKGYAPALEVRVGARAYDRVDSLYGLPAETRAYRFAAETPLGPLLEFAGPLPSGQPITAAYRKGGGAKGNVGAGRLTTVMTPVPGLRGATNPLAAEGGAEPEGPDDVRNALPASTRTLDRTVALEDFQAFAQAYRGVGKAFASELRQGMRHVLCMTIADTAFQNPAPGSDLLTGLRKAILDASPPGRTIRIEGFESLTATVGIAFAHDPALERAKVQADVRAALLRAFSPEMRPFGRALHIAEVMTATQNLPGVLAARVTAFSLPGGPPADAGRLLCPLPRFEESQPGGPLVFQRAGLISLSDASLALTEMLP
ncbi:baseplate J/gp47 family protein [Rhizobium sp. WYCCWR 11128]|uniref:baseplate J/gp47 family protein n=1 Tax=Rhizobium sp. WYCCWR 11128 TaxID=2749832 RepID=UPI0015D350CA|nr:baseplate J/gp47 family protein [Rhizobium sp. WYCCWR 11128]NYT32053.1 baseplate J/gp47 family protein [Rhizobium sp. WYCCWR 11128]